MAFHISDAARMQAITKYRSDICWNSWYVRHGIDYKIITQKNIIIMYPQSPWNTVDRIPLSSHGAMIYKHDDPNYDSYAVLLEWMNMN